MNPPVLFPPDPRPSPECSGGLPRNDADQGPFFPGADAPTARLCAEIAEGAPGWRRYARHAHRLACARLRVAQRPHRRQRSARAARQPRVRTAIASGDDGEPPASAWLA